MPSHRFFLKMAFNTIFPIFLSNPALEVGIPVSRANFCLACVIPSARFKAVSYTHLTLPTTSRV